MEDYRNTLVPGQVRDLLDSALVALDQGLSGELGDVAFHLGGAVLDVIEAVAVGGDEPTLDGILALATSTLDGASEEILDFVEATSKTQGGSFSGSTAQIEVPSTPLARLALDSARLIVGNVGAGISRFEPGVTEYAGAVQLSLEAETEVNERMQELSDCILGSGTDPIPADICGAVPTTSQWGLIVLTLLVLSAGTVVLGKRCRAAA